MMGALRPVGIVDLGLVADFLSTTPKVLPRALAIDHTASHLALAHANTVALATTDDGAPPAVLAKTPEPVETLAWMNIAASAAESIEAVLLAGCSSGALRGWAVSGAPVLSVRLHASPLRCLSVHSDSPFGEHSEVLALFSGGSIAHARGGELAHLLRGRMSPSDGQHGTPEDAFCVFDLGSRGSDFASLASGGPLPTPPLELERKPTGSPSTCVIVADASSLQMHLVDAASAHETRSAASIRELATELATVATHTATSMLTAFGLDRTSKLLTAAHGAVVARIELPQASPVSIPPLPVGDTVLVRSMVDPPRQFVSVLAEPCRRWVAASDSLGRVLLLEARTLVVLRIWKGYRDAQCGWVVDQDGSALMVIYAPRRGLLELWEVPAGPRSLATVVGQGCQLISTQTPVEPRAPSSDTSGAAALADLAVGLRGVNPDEREPSAGPLGRCFVLQPTGPLSEIVTG